MKTVYAHDADGWYIGSADLNDSDLSPLEPGVYLIPGNATELVPPAFGPEWRPRWVSGEWQLVELSGTVPTPPTDPTPQELILQTIQQMERDHLMPRITREVILRMAEKEAQKLAELHGVDPALLLAKNKGYTALKAFDDQIALLREQL